MKKRLLALMMALMMLALTGCGNASSDPENDSSEGTASLTVDLPQEAMDDVISYCTDGAITKDSVLYTVNGVDVTAADYFYWLTYEEYYCTYIYAYYNYKTIELTDTFYGDMTLGEYILALAESYSTLFAALENATTSAGTTLSADYQAALDSVLSDLANSLAESAWNTAVEDGTVVADDFDDEAKAAWLEAAGQERLKQFLIYYATTQDAYESFCTVDYLSMQLQDDLYGEGGELEPTQEELADYVEDNGIYACRYILFYAKTDSDGNRVDADGNVLDDDGLAALESSARDCFNEIYALSGEEQNSAVSTYMANNYDGNTSQYIFDSSSTLVDGFRETVAALDVGAVGLSELTDYGYFVVVRDEVTADTELSTDTTLLDTYIAEAYQVYVDQLITDAEIVNHGLLDDFDVVAFFDKLYELRDIIDEAEDASDSDATETDTLETE